MKVTINFEFKRGAMDRYHLCRTICNLFDDVGTDGARSALLNIRDGDKWYHCFYNLDYDVNSELGRITSIAIKIDFIHIGHTDHPMKSFSDACLEKSCWQTEFGAISFDDWENIFGKAEALVRLRYIVYQLVATGKPEFKFLFLERAKMKIENKDKRSFQETFKAPFQI